MIYAGILAGGVGTRMQHEDMPKQFLELGGKPILIHTIEQFLINPRVDETIVALPKLWVSYSIDLVRRHISTPERIKLISGGSTRNESLMAVLADIELRHGIKEGDVIISHDAVRPFVSARIINDNIDGVQRHAAVDTVIPAYDTIVESADGDRIDRIPSRTSMYQGQTPQSFQILALKRLYSELTDEEKAALTDAAKIFILRGEPVYLVKGDVSNLKITTPYDLKVANTLMRG